MGLQETKIESLPFVTAELNYLAPVSGKPRTYAFDPPPGEPKSTSLPEPHQVPIFDARLIADNFSLDREGFALVRHPTRVKDFYNDEDVSRVLATSFNSVWRRALPFHLAQAGLSFQSFRDITRLLARSAGHL